MKTAYFEARGDLEPGRPRKASRGYPGKAVGGPRGVLWGPWGILENPLAGGILGSLLGSLWVPPRALGIAGEVMGGPWGWEGVPRETSGNPWEVMGESRAGPRKAADPCLAPTKRQDLP